MGRRVDFDAKRFVGRAHELDQLDALCGATAKGHGTLVVVSGEAGIGKTRFCEEVADHAHHAGLRAMTARCWADGGAPPLWPWQPILTDLCGDDALALLATDGTTGTSASYAEGASASNGHGISTGNDATKLGASSTGAANNGTASTISVGTTHNGTGNTDAVTNDAVSTGHISVGTTDADRFTRFTAIVDRLANACADTPVCLVIDDVQAADAGTLLLIRFVAHSLQHLRLMLVLTRRTGEPAGDTPEARLLDEIEGEALPVTLHHFDCHEATEFLAVHGLELRPETMTTLLRVTKGNPLFLRRIAALGPAPSSETLPQGLVVAIDQALTRVSPEARRVLRMSAVLGPTPSVAEAAAVAESHPVAVLAAVNEAIGAGLVTADQADRFSFSHDVVRSSLERGLHVAERLDAHARAVAVVGGGDHPTSDQLARRAFHARAAAPRSADDARLAVAACRDAARAMVRSFAYELADTLLSAAVDLHETTNVGSPPARLLVEWAQAAWRCGHMTLARQRFDRAADAAQREDDPVVRAEAALGLGGHWVNEHRAPVERARVLALQRSALAGLPEEHVALRWRLQARLAAEAVFDGEPVEPVLEALDEIRRCGDPLALAEALSLTHHVLFRADHTPTCLGLAEELVRVAAEAGDGVPTLMGLCWRAVDLFHLGDQRALRALEDLRERANALANQDILYYVAVMDVMLLARAGRLDEADAAAHRCFELGEAVGEVDSIGYLAAQTVAIRWLQNRDFEVFELAKQVTSSPTLAKTEFSLHASAVVVIARAGYHRMARAELDRIAPDGLAALPQSSTWLVGMVAMIETAAELDDVTLAREAYDLLLPYADLPVIASLGVACMGSAERSLGLAAVTFGDLDRGIGHLERAIAANRRLANKPLTIMAHAHLAAALRQRGRPGDRAAAVDLLRQVCLWGPYNGMASRATQWQKELDELEGQPSSNGATPSTPTVRSGETSRHGVISRRGNRWLVQVDDRQVWVPDLVGMRYIAELVTNPGQPISAILLAGQGSMLNDASPHELLDDKARAAYRDRVRELTSDLAEAEADNDIGRAERLRAELDAVVDEIEAATGLGNRPRRFADPGERARTAVRKAIKRAIDTIDDADPVIAGVLRSTIETGNTCIYTPDPNVPVGWSTLPRTNGHTPEVPATTAGTAT